MISGFRALNFRRRQFATATLVANALHPPSNYWLGAPAMFGGWLTGELAPHLLAVTAADALREVMKRKDTPGLALATASAAGLGFLIRQSMKAEEVVDTALREALGPNYPRQPAPRDADVDLTTPWYQLAFPLVLRNADVEIIKDVAYGKPGDLTSLDVYRRKHAMRDAAPVLVHIHGGMWMSGDKKYEGLPLMLHMAAHGWVCVNVNYRLCPKHPFPAQIIDIKRAIAWVRAHGEEYGADPSYIAVSGGSAGGHLAALAALTPGDPEYQPGCEDADTTVAAAVPHYGIYDFAAVSGTDHAIKRRNRFLARFILKKDPVADHEDFERASPLLRASADAPPFFVIHGANDTGVEVTEARYFVQRLRQLSRRPVAYAELPGAQHAFDFFPSIRSAHVLGAVERFLDWSFAQHGAKTGGG